MGCPTLFLCVMTNFVRKSKLLSKIKILVENRTFGQKIEMLVKNLNFGQKSKLFWKIEILVENRSFGQKSKLLFKNRNFGQESKFWSKIEIWVKNRSFGQKSKILSKIEILTKQKYGLSCSWVALIYAPLYIYFFEKIRFFLWRL